MFFENSSNILLIQTNLSRLNPHTQSTNNFSVSEYTANLFALRFSTLSMSGTGVVDRTIAMTAVVSTSHTISGDTSSRARV